MMFYVYDSGKTVKPNYVPPPTKKYKDRPQVAVPTNCKNCGAPLHGRKCEYCDTEYW